MTNEQHDRLVLRSHLIAPYSDHRTEAMPRTCWRDRSTPSRLTFRERRGFLRQPTGSQSQSSRRSKQASRRQGRVRVDLLIELAGLGWIGSWLIGGEATEDFRGWKARQAVLNPLRSRMKRKAPDRTWQKRLVALLRVGERERIQETRMTTTLKSASNRLYNGEALDFRTAVDLHIRALIDEEQASQRGWRDLVNQGAVDETDANERANLTNDFTEYKESARACQAEYEALIATAERDLFAKWVASGDYEKRLIGEAGLAGDWSGLAI